MLLHNIMILRNIMILHGIMIYICTDVVSQVLQLSLREASGLGNLTKTWFALKPNLASF